MQTVDFGRSIGKTYWTTPWDYLVEAGQFDMPFEEDGKLYGFPMGRGRGVNLRVGTVPTMPEGYEYEPLVSRLFLFHAAAFLHLPEDMTTAEALRKIGTDECLRVAALLETYGSDLDRFSFFFYYVQSLIQTGAKAAGLKISSSAGAFAYTLLAARSFVRYHRDGEAQPGSDPRITDVFIVEDPSDVYDPTGRTTVTLKESEDDA